MRYLLFFLFPALLLCPLKSSCQNADNFRYEHGDLLFQDLDCGGLCDAIEAVTPATAGKHFSHIGLVCKKADSIYVIEAIGKDVHLTPLRQFMRRQLDAAGRPKIVVGRLKPAYRKLNDAAIDYALSTIGTPYDDRFLYDNGKYYCSELIYDAYKAANGGKAFFRLYPMTFKDPASGQTFPAWTDYYRKLGTVIPEGKAGCNPGGIAHSSQIAIVASFY